MDSSHRRRFLQTVAAISTVGIAGCNQFSSEMSGEDQDESVHIPEEATFEFDHSDEALTIHLTEGEKIPASNLVIQSSNGTQARWHELGSSAVSASGNVTSGDSVTIGASVLNWPDAVEQSEKIRVVFMTEGGSPTTLATYEPSATETPTETPNSSTIFTDEFDDGNYTDVWTVVPDNRPDDTISESDETLIHESSHSYNNGSTLLSSREFNAEGTRRIEVRMKTHISDYWGYGFGFSFDSGGVHLREHKWEGYDRFGVNGIEDHPPKYDSQYDDNYSYYDDTHFAKVEPATSGTDWMDYSLTVDFDSDTVVAISRDNQEFELDLKLRNSSDTYQLTIGDGRGHEVEYEYIRVYEE